VLGPGRALRDYRLEWLDELTLSGEFAWGRLWGGAASSIRVTPLSFVPREDLDLWLAIERSPADGRGFERSGERSAQGRLYGHTGAIFPLTLPAGGRPATRYVDMGLADLLAHGLVTCDSFASLRQMITPPSRRRRPINQVGRWELLSDQ